LAPRLNATGRLDVPDTALDLLLTDDAQQARLLAGRLEGLNRERKAIQERMVRQAQEMMEDLSETGRKFIVLAHEDWHRGVVGIAASKLADIYRRPVILLAVEHGLALGSGRSIPGFNLFEALRSCQDLLDHFGGHDMAAGLGCKADRLPDLAAALEEIASATLPDEALRPCLEIETVVSDDELTPNLGTHLARLAPFGYGNPEPTLAVPGLTVLSCGIVGQNHLRLRLKGRSRTLEAIGFGLGGLLPDLGPSVTAALQPLASTYRGELTYGWQVVDIKSEQDLPAPA
jgi:single-stranded-DNA-specific exonuclease